MRYNPFSCLSNKNKILILAVLWLIVISLLHYYLNFEQEKRTVIKIGYMPVITNMSAPILDYITVDKNEIRFETIKFASFAEMAEAFKLDEIQFAFIIAPLSIVLYSQNIPLKIIYIGNRHESSLITAKTSGIKHFNQLNGKTVAVPLKFSGHNIFIKRMMEKQGMNTNSINIVEMQPPDMTSALAAGGIDAYCVGEPFAAQAIMKGYADLLLPVETNWPGFICNLVIVKEEMIKKNKNIVSTFVNSLIRANYWTQNNLPEAVQIASDYWGQKPEIINYVFNNPPGRVIFDQYIPKQAELQELSDWMYHFNMLDSKINVSGLIDSSFALQTDTSHIRINSIFP
ncbi:MAG: ABC transporter substrate-binding protein [Calditrichia bacterium]|nr:ABC transporter substrate-binding protein [Calditrichia bacterium]